VGAERTGTGWTEFPSWLRGVSRALPNTDKRMLYVFGTMSLDAIHKRIKSQPKEWDPLKPETEARKLRLGLDPRMMLATQQFFDRLTIIQTSKGRIFIGATKKVHPPSGFRMRDIAAIHEWGTDVIPPRPLFGPVTREMTKKAPQVFKRVLREMANQRG